MVLTLFQSFTLQLPAGHYNTKHGPQVHGPPPWTTPHFVKLQAEKALDKTKDRNDPHTYQDNSSIIISYRHLKNSGSANGIQTVICDVSYEATQVGAGQFVGLIILLQWRTRRMKCQYCIFEVLVIDKLWPFEATKYR